MKLKLLRKTILFDNLFALENGKESKNDERTLLWDHPRFLDLAVNP